jgi:HEAT repeat protein
MKARRAVILAVTVAGILAAVGGGVFLTVLPSSRIDAASRDPNPAVRAAAVRGLDVNADADRLLSALKDADPDVRLLSAMWLGAWPLGTPATFQEKVAPGLIEALKDRHAGVRHAAAGSLGGLWPATEEALADGLTDSDPRVRAGAAFALSLAPDGMSGREVTAAQAERLRPLLRALLNDENSEVRQNATLALEGIH